MTTTAATLRSRRTVPRAVLVRRATALATGLAVVLGGWWLAAKAYGIPQLFPTPADTFRELSRSASDGSLFSATGASLRRIFIGLAIGSAAGVLLGLAAGASRFVWWFAEPFVNFFRFIPPLAWFAPVLLWFGAGETSKLVLIFYTTVFVVALNTMAGVRAVPRNKIRMAQSVGARRCHIFFLVMLPASMPCATRLRLSVNKRARFRTVGARCSRAHYALTSCDYASILPTTAPIFTVGQSSLACALCRER